MSDLISIPKAELEQLRMHVTEALKIIDRYSIPSDAPVKKLSEKEKRVQHFTKLLDKKGKK